MPPFFTTHKTMLIVSAIVAVVFFFAGMQYKAYQIRSVMQSAFQDLGKSLGEGFKSVESKPEVKTPPIAVPAGSSITLTGSEKQSQYKLGVLETGSPGKRVESGYSSYTATKTFHTVVLAGENIGKAPDNLYFWYYSFEIRTSDGTRFAATQSEQTFGKKITGYEACLGCKNNPWDKGSEVIIFDADFSLTGATLIWNKEKGEVYEFAL